MLAPAMSEFLKRLYTALILLICFGGAYLHSTTLFILFLSGILFLCSPPSGRISIPFPRPMVALHAYLPRAAHAHPYLFDRHLPRHRLFLAPLSIFCSVVCRHRRLFIGKLWGNHKMCPSISPGKSWEGFMGSLVFVGIVQMVVLHHITTFSKLNNIWTILLLTVIMTSIAFLGGLWLSILKRRQGLKDAGSLLPGHGGLMDRFDGVMFVGLATAAMAVWLR